MSSVPLTTHNPVQQKDRLYDWFPVLIVENVHARCCPLDQGEGPSGRDIMLRE
jgi:hypothetical protein